MKNIVVLLKLATLVGTFVGGATFAEPGRAQNYPQKVITMVVPYAAGGASDIAARVIIQRMSSSLGQQIIVENVPGAGGAIGTSRVVRAEPDGYTLLMQQNGLVIGEALNPKLTFKVEKDLTAIGLVNTTYAILVARKTLPVTSMPELVTWMKGPGRPAKFAHAGNGTLAHLQAVMFAEAVGAEVIQVPYRGGGPAMADLIAGHVDLFWAAPASSTSLIESGTIKALGYGASKPLPAFPNLPVLARLGYGEMDVPFWHALFAPAATPKPIIQRLNAALREALADPQVRKAYADKGVEGIPAEQQSPEAANAFVRSEIGRWTKVVRDNNITPEN
jgi:tripartite-type tricarboxylate transporter receptor subunit TctC